MSMLFMQRHMLGCLVCLQHSALVPGSMADTARMRDVHNRLHACQMGCCHAGNHGRKEDQ